MLNELLSSEFNLYAVYALETYLPSLQISGKLPENVKITAVTQAELQKMSVLRTTNKVLAVAHLPRNAVHPPWEPGPTQTDANGGPAGRPTEAAPGKPEAGTEAERSGPGSGGGRDS